MRRPGRTCDLQAVAYDEHSDRYFATTFKTPRGAIRRSDGGEWHEVLELDAEFDGTPLTMVPRALHVRDGAIAVVGEGDRIDAEDNEISLPFVAISEDGTDWHLSVGWPDEDASHRASAIGHGRLVVAAGGQVWYADLADLGVATAIAEEATSETGGSTDEPAQPVGLELQRIIRARRSFGFETDPDIVRAIRRDPYQPDSRQFGFPMTVAEAQDLSARSGWSGRASSIRPWLRKQDGFGGIWIDQRDGGAIAIAFTEADLDVISEIERRFATFGGLTPWKLVIVPRSYEELRDAFRRARRVSRAIDPDAMLWSVGLDESGGAISLLYDPDDVGRMRTKKKALERRLGVPVRIEGGRVRDL